MGHLTAGVLISLGALCVNSIDTPGPPIHRRNSLLVGAAVVFLSSIAMTSYFVNDWFGNLVVLILVFVLSMTGVYGTRASTIGMAGIYALILVTEEKGSFYSYINNSLFFFVGALWYAFISLISHNIRPFQLIQQALAECIFKTADFLRLRASFYSLQTSKGHVSEQLIKLQIEINNSQQVVRSLLLQRYTLNSEGSPKGRSLLLILLDTIDVYEQITASPIDTNLVHDTFDQSGILNDYLELTLNLASELDEIASSVASGKPSSPKTNIKKKLELLQQNTLNLRKKLLNQTSLSAFVSLNNVRKNLSLINDKISSLHRYTRYGGGEQQKNISLPDFLEHDDYSFQRLKSNLGIHSIQFRHALRVGFAIALGILISEFLPVQRSYWILFTIVVILKPGFSLSKSRNKDRLIGTLFGGIATVLILFFIKKQIILFILLVICLVITYSFTTLNYALSTFTTTCFVLIFFDFLKPGDLSFLKLRLIDTAIGSGIAFISSYFIFPVWEFQNINMLLCRMLDANRHYFVSVTQGYTTNSINESNYRLARKAVYVSSGNLGDAFQRMLNEPKNKQVFLDSTYQFIALNMALTSHIASLAAYLPLYSSKLQLPAIASLAHSAATFLENATDHIQNKMANAEVIYNAKELNELKSFIEKLKIERLKEIELGIEESELRQQLPELNLISEQFQDIYRLSNDIMRLCNNLSVK